MDNYPQLLEFIESNKKNNEFIDKILGKISGKLLHVNDREKVRRIVEAIVAVQEEEE